jgi:MoaA/NifB/PqqE/SkfB family radical SAM enzyme
MSETELRDALIQARDLGVFFIVLIGGEPLVRPDIMPITKDFPDLIFFVFSNGTLVTEEMARQFRRQKNIVPILSIEGYTTETDGRRGGGVYEKVQEAIRKLRRQNVFFGASVTVTRDNFKAVTKENFVAGLTGFGCKLLLFAEYTPVQPGTDEWVVTNEQRRNLVSILEGFRRKFPAFFVSSPNDEKAFGGCLAAGRGFVHVSACGDVEPCPFVPYSDVSLRKKTLSEALQSPLLRAIREQDNLLGEAEGGCALWMRREWVYSLLSHEQTRDSCSGS